MNGSLLSVPSEFPELEEGDLTPVGTKGCSGEPTPGRRPKTPLGSLPEKINPSPRAQEGSLGWGEILLLMTCLCVPGPEGEVTGYLNRDKSVCQRGRDWIGA
ncbi:unnamed protein product [Pleuronectes platessa]|uniref:Uncharacterized protein n=1 Tax=Pleuronectes platessa TaxID=8262 RepID=A0A9N7Z501_PLEPL|nr:unnamed protein product [Pleuronectes platessa]